MILLDPTPCLRYRWTESPCRAIYSGTHVCRHAGGHAGPCECDACGEVGDGEDRAVVEIVHADLTGPVFRALVEEGQSLRRTHDPAMRATAGPK